jgi:hypothetical protein
MMNPQAVYIHPDLLYHLHNSSNRTRGSCDRRRGCGVETMECVKTAKSSRKVKLDFDMINMTSV